MKNKIQLRCKLQTFTEVFFGYSNILSISAVDPSRTDFEAINCNCGSSYVQCTNTSKITSYINLVKISMG